MKKRMKAKIMLCGGATVLLGLSGCLLTSCFKNEVIQNENQIIGINVDTIQPQLNPHLFANNPVLKNIDNWFRLTEIEFEALLNQLFVGNNYLSSNFEITSLQYNSLTRNLYVELKINNIHEYGFQKPGDDKYYAYVNWDYVVPLYEVDLPHANLKEGISANDIPPTINKYNVLNYLDIYYDVSNCYIANVTKGVLDNSDKTENIYIGFIAKPGACFLKNGEQVNGCEIVVDIGNEQHELPTPHPKLNKPLTTILDDPMIKNISIHNYRNYLIDTEYANMRIKNVECIAISQYQYFIKVTYLANPGYIFANNQSTFICNLEVLYANYVDFPKVVLNEGITTATSGLDKISVRTIKQFVSWTDKRGFFVSRVRYDATEKRININFECERGYLFHPVNSEIYTSSFGTMVVVPEDILHPIAQKPQITLKSGIYQDNQDLINLDNNNLDNFVTIVGGEDVTIIEAFYDPHDHNIIISFAPKPGYYFENEIFEDVIKVFVPYQ